MGNVHTKRMEYMGTSTTPTVYAAELKGLDLAFQTALEVHATTNQPSKCIIFTDDQAALQTMANPKFPSGQYVLAAAIESLGKLRDKGWDVKTRGIPAHVGVPAHEAADLAAKEAASLRQDPQTNPDTAPNLAPGDYLLRGEIIALHSASSSGGAQFS